MDGGRQPALATGAVTSRVKGQAFKVARSLDQSELGIPCQPNPVATLCVIFCSFQMCSMYCYATKRTHLYPNCLWISLLVLCAMASRAFDVELLHIAEHFSIPVSEVAVNWHEIPGTYIYIFTMDAGMFQSWHITSPHRDVRQYTRCSKKVSCLMFDNNFGKCGLIFKFFSPGDL